MVKNVRLSMSGMRWPWSFVVELPKKTICKKNKNGTCS
jgi:hypothetical protein